MKSIHQIRTLGELKKSGYQPRSVKEELRANLIEKIRRKETVFPGMPDVERAVLSRHNIILLGLRGQAKTRIARLLINLLDEHIPVVAGSELNDDPLAPISRFAKDLLAEKGDDTPVEWLHRDERYVEKLATPDVSIADLVGDVDPIKAANLRLPYSDERVIHYPASAPLPFRYQRIARLAGADSGVALQRVARRRYADPGLQIAPAARCGVCIHGQPRGLHQSWQHHHPAQRPHRKPNNDPLPYLD
jgi:hypothetical protein